MENLGVQEHITAFWDVLAPFYESPNNVAFPGTAEYTHWVEAIRSVLPGSPAQILDLGTGTGFVARIAAELGHTVTATDLSAPMLKAAVALAVTAHPAITFAPGDAVDPEFPPASFDVVINRSLLWTLREPERALRNWYTLVRPGGRVVSIYGLSTVDGSETTPEDTGDGSEDENLFALYYSADTRAALTAMHLHDHEPLLRAAEAAGFSDVGVVALTSVAGWETSPSSDQPYALTGHRR